MSIFAAETLSSEIFSFPGRHSLVERSKLLTQLPRLINGQYVSGNCENTVGRIVKDGDASPPDSILLTESLKEATDYSSYSAVLVLTKHQLAINKSPSTLVWIADAGALQSGDIIAIRPSGQISVLYRRLSIHNALFVTEKCNSRCLMCSQPPRKVDHSPLLKEAMKVIELADPATITLGITGGEPTLLRDDLILLLARCRDLLPQTSIHLLTNGRLFCNRTFAERIAAIGHPSLTMGIPLYSAIDTEHDRIVGAEGAFDQTVLGILNLAHYQIAVELRTVVQRINAPHMLEFSDFVYRNLPFVSHVAFMGMEPTGLAKINIKELWIDPADYSSDLAEAVQCLAARGLNVSIFNHQLCTVPRSIWQLCRQSISDWKMVFLSGCERCSVKPFCAGLFESALSSYHSRVIAPLSIEYSS